MTVSFEIPDAKAQLLLDMMSKRYVGLKIPTTKAGKSILLTKLIQQDIINSMRQVIGEQKSQEAVQAIKADPDLAESPLEAELKLVAPAQE
jgi:hypothetical protein